MELSKKAQDINEVNIAKLTKSQKETLREYQRGETLVRVSFPDPELSNRARFFVQCTRAFNFHVYVGKRGKVYETATGDY